MATALRSHFGGWINPPPPTVPKTADMRKAERAEKKQARLNARAEYQRLREAARRKHLIRAIEAEGIPTAWPVGAKPRKQQRAEDWDVQVARRMIRRWFGAEVERVPMIMADLRYWHALQCGWQMLRGRDVNNAPADPVDFATWGWWVNDLNSSQRAMFRRRARDEGQGCYRDRFFA